MTAFQMCLHGFVLSHGQLSSPDAREMYQSVPLETGAVRIGKKKICILDYKTLLGYENFQIALINYDISQAKFNTKSRFENVNYKFNRTQISLASKMPS